MFEYFRMTSGLKGLAIRYIILKSSAKRCGNNVSVHPGVYLYNIEKLSLGNNISIHPMCYLDAAGEIVIEDDVSIAHGVTIMSSSHNYSSSNIKIKDQGIEKQKVIIKSNVWIGAKATVLSNVIVSSGTVIGANSVVTKLFPEDLVIAGVPAKILKERKAKDE